MFLDELEFVVRGGKGGDGAVSFHREKFVPRGGPDGGDGGRGGAVILRASQHENTLYHLAGKPVYEARKGQPGSRRDMTGRSADDLELLVPVGTVVLDAQRGNSLRDLQNPDDTFEVVRGGRGGRGNARFSSSTNRTPREAEEGQLGEERRIRLSLKLIADAGLVGLPNAGKSTLLASLSRARPKIADYPFTTLEPNLGIVPFVGGGSAVFADIPGLIEGAHEGKGLGVQFLKHIERTRVLLHLVDCSSGADEEPLKAFEVITNELKGYSIDLISRPRLVLATKVEDEESLARAAELRGAVGLEVIPISSAMNRGMERLFHWLRAQLQTG
ncbi:MAG: GTPase ObgE [Planctomycetota bacterium]